MDEREVILAWRGLIRGKEVTPEALGKAEKLLDGLSGESPLHLRLAQELDELKKMRKPAPKKKVRERSKASQSPPG